MSETKIIPRKEILSILTQDAYYRKLGTWPLLTSELFLKTIDKKEYKEMFYLFPTSFYGRQRKTVSLLDDIIKEFNYKQPFVNSLLTKFVGHLVVCGGSIIKSIYNDSNYDLYRKYDVDFFFYDLNIEEANQMRIDIITYLIDLWKQEIGKKDNPHIEPHRTDILKNVEFYVQRNEFVTTIYIIEKYPSDFNLEYMYQFIHRIYPNMSSIIGGFDIGSCMVAYDGKEIYATPLGVWSIINRTIIIDTKRRSTSYEYRLYKYFLYGFTILFPGLSHDIINRYLKIDSSKNFQDQTEEPIFVRYLSKMDSPEDFHEQSEELAFEDFQKQVEELAKINGYEINYDIDLQEVFHKIKSNNHDIQIKSNIYDIQIKEDILPYFKLYPKLNDIKMPNYDRENVSDKFLNRVSDYSHDHMYPCYLPIANACKLRLNNLNGVVSICHITINDIAENKLLYDIDNPDLGFTDKIIEKYKKRVDNIRNLYICRWTNKENKYYDYYRVLRCFGKLTPEVIECRYTDTYYHYRDIMIETMKENAKICYNNLIGVKWITNNPGRQWTSSINPVFADPREWYGKHYIPVITGIPSEIEICLRLMTLRESYWSILPKDIFNHILLYINKNYADEAWKYII